jgi:hypothetical protein
MTTVKLRTRSEAGPNAVADRAANAADKILRGEKRSHRPSMSGASRFPNDTAGTGHANVLNKKFKIEYPLPPKADITVIAKGFRVAVG